MKSHRTGAVQFTLLIATLIVIGLFVQIRSVDVDLHFRRMDLLLQLEQAEAQLDRDVRNVVTFPLEQYDPFVAHARTICALALELGSPELALSSKIMIDAYVQPLDDKLVLMERIKSQAVLVRNGLHYLPTAIEELGGRNHALGLEISALFNRLLHLQLFPSASESETIAQEIDDFEAIAEVDEAARPLFDNILVHLRTNLRLIDELASLRDRYGAVDSGARLVALYRDYAGRYSSQIRRAEVFTVTLLLVAVVLFVGFGFALYSISKSRREAGDQLRSAVESLSEAFALFAPDGRLILHNGKYLEFYPWLDGVLNPDTRLEDILERNAKSGMFAVADGADARYRFLHPRLPCSGNHSYLEELTDGRWYLASDTCTKAGELACVRVDITDSKRTEQELRKLYRGLEQSPASVMITDTRGTIEYVNPKFEETTGYTAEEALGQNPRILKSGDKYPEEYKELWDTILAGKVWRGQFHNRRKDGEIYWEAASISPVRDAVGHITHFIAVKEDITVKKRAEDQLRLNATVFDTTTEGIMVTDADNRIKTVNPAFTRITGYLSDEAIGRDPRMLSSGRHDQVFFTAMWKSLMDKGYWSGEIWNRRKDGSVFPVWLSLATISNSGGPVREYVAVFSDITQRKQDEELMRRQANYDALTGLPNRTLLFDRLARALAGARRDPGIVALLFVDLDRFKCVNDTLGHVAGDELLQQVAARLEACVREADTVGRFGGDEFVIILEDLKSVSDAAEVAKKVIATLERPFDLAAREAFIGGSIGITLYPNDSDDAASMLRNADMAMYRAKDAGRNTYRFFTPAMNEEVQRRMLLESDLRLAQERDELTLRYKPIVRIADGRVVGLEVLLLWKHPTRGTLKPESFIPLAEETGLIGSIGRWVLRHACAQAGAWRNAGLELSLHVDLSSHQLTLELTIEEVERILRDSGLPPSALTLEITETMLVDNPQAVRSKLAELGAVGIGLAVDDFGSSYSSLRCLKRLPMDTLKINRGFVNGLLAEKEYASLVEAIAAMAYSLGLRLVAEGVETNEQLRFLERLGCELAQGSLFSRPVDAGKVPELARRQLGKASNDESSAS